MSHVVATICCNVYRMEFCAKNYYYYYCYTKHFFLAHTPAGAESDLNAAAGAPSQTEVTDLNCSDHSTTSKEMARGELW